jgi:hypothetical protein
MSCQVSCQRAGTGEWIPPALKICAVHEFKEIKSSSIYYIVDYCRLIVLVPLELLPGIWMLITEMYTIGPAPLFRANNAKSVNDSLNDLAARKAIAPTSINEMCCAICTGAFSSA